MSEILDRILNKQKEQTYTCKRCTMTFTDRKELGKHIYKVHNTQLSKPKRFVLPRELIEELKYVSNGSFINLSIQGELTDKGVEVEKIKYL